jgi:hypothetical protein
MTTYGGVDVKIHVSLTSTLVGGEWSTSRPCSFTPEICSAKQYEQCKHT